MLRISVVVGNPKARSTTRAVAEALVGQMFADGSYEIEVIDLADHVAEVFAWPSESMATLNGRVAASDVAIFASPTYKATYTGLLKAFLDRFPANGLAGVMAIPVMTGADATHALGPDSHLIPLLVELGASVPGRGFYFIASHMDQVDDLVSAAATEYSDNIWRMATVSGSLRSSIPTPVATATNH